MPGSNSNSIDDPISLNVAGVRELVENKTNKILKGTRVEGEGPKGQEIDELELPMSDEELLRLAVSYESLYKDYEGRIKQRQEWNKKYYLGRQLEGTQYNVEFPIAANLLFEAEETFLPAALSRNPEPVVWSDNSEQGTKIANDVKTMLQYHADVLVLRRKLAWVVRHWSIYFIGVLKHGFDTGINEIKTEVRNPRNFILQPTGYVDVYGDFQGWMGEKITITAEELIEQNPHEREYISKSVSGKLGTRVTYTEWWSEDGSYYFCTYMDRVLEKHKNPHFNYVTDKVGDQQPHQNNFARPKKPYTFLSVFSLGEQPHDITSLIEQNIPNQNLISKRTMQIDVNLSRQNNSVAFSGSNFNQQTAKQASQAFEKGNPVLVPEGRPIGEAIVRFPAEAYPQAAFTELTENKENLRASFGTQGITAQQQNEKTTARGMILNQQRDNTRIGGGIGDALSQVADNVFNWWVQLYYVYYDEPHMAAIIGSAKATEYVVIESSMLTSKLIVSVQADSMKPKDEITQMNQAVQLFEAGALDPKSLLTILNVPDTDNTIKRTVLWMVDKGQYLQKYFPELLPQPAPMAPGMPPGAPPGAVPSPLTAAGGGNPPNVKIPQPQSPAPTLASEPPHASLRQVKLPG